MARHGKNKIGRIFEERFAAAGIIKESAPEKLDRVVFCFKYFDSTHKTFTVDHLPKQFGKWLLEKFRGYGQMPFADFAPLRGNPSIHSHVADVARINAHGGFPKQIPPDLWADRPWQIAIQNKIRAIGFIRDSVFHVVWIDPDHKFDPGRGR